MKNVSSSRVRIQSWSSSLMQVLAMTVVILVCTQLGYAQTLIDCASSSNVQSQINGAAPGAYLKCNSTGPYSWSPFQVSISGTAGLTLDGNGASVNGGIAISVNASVSTRVTNFTLTASGNNTNAQASILVNTCNFTSARWRVDHVTFTGSGSNVVALNQCPGVFDHNSMTNGHAADEQVHVTGWGATNTTGWITAMPSGANSGGSRALGSDEAIYFENNTFSASSYSNSNPSWIESYYGARIVYRHNTFNYFKTDAHGGANQVGTRWWEFYNNDYHEMAGGNAGGYSHNLRAGSGIIFNETYSGTINPQPNIGMCNETQSSYPAPYQIGRGTNQGSDPAYTWNNRQNVSLNACEAVTLGGFVAFNRDVYTDVNSASCTAGGSCTSGVGVGATLPTSCTAGVAFWNTNAGGHWDQTTSNTNDGALYQCTATNTWTLYYTPYTYPHPLITGNVSPPPPPSPPAITNPGSASGTAGSAFSYQITATNSPTSYGASGLPGGLSVNTATGLISGTPTATGTSTVTLNATNSAGTGTATVTLTISSAPASAIPFNIPNLGAMSWLLVGTPGTVTVGDAAGRLGSGSTALSGVAIFALRETGVPGFGSSGVLVTEAGVPATPLMQAGRIYAEVNGPVNTGIAIANPGGQDAAVSFYFTDTTGQIFGSGSTTIPAGQQIAKFLNEAPFSSGNPIEGTLTFTSSAPVTVIALRSLVNARADFLVATLPVVNLSSSVSSSVVVLPQFADGGGWVTSVILVNPTDNVLSGTIQFLDPTGAPVGLSAGGPALMSFSYAIPPKSSFKLVTAGAGAATTSGSVRVVPASNTAAPTALAVYSYQPAGITVTLAGVPSISGTAFRAYVEASNTTGAVLRSGLAIANADTNPATVNLALFNAGGTPVATTSLTIAGSGQIAKFLGELFPSLPQSFQGVLRISTTSSSPLAVVGLRTRINERGDFLITTTPPTDENAPSAGQLFFPHLAIGGGYTTQLILFSGSPGPSSSGTLNLVTQSGVPWLVTTQ